MSSVDICVEREREEQCTCGFVPGTVSQGRVDEVKDCKISCRLLTLILLRVASCEATGELEQGSDMI